MWSIVWKFNQKIKADTLFFDSKEQASEYAKYYQDIFKSHLKTNNIQNRFNKKTNNQITIDYKIIAKQET
jgi:hypothetical protein